MKPATICFWLGSELFVSHGGHLTEVPLSGDPVALLSDYLANLEPRPKAVRFIYSSPDHEVTEVNCPKGGRNVVRRCLSQDHSSLSNTSVLFACTHFSRLESENTYTTILHVETKPRLRRLQLALGERGIRIEGAWPFACLVEALPQCPAGSPAVAFLGAAQSGFFYCATPSGARKATLLNGDDITNTGLNAAQQTLSGFSGAASPPALVFSFAGLPIDATDGRLAACKVSVLSLEDVVGAVASLKPNDLGNLLPPRTELSINLFLGFFGAIFLIYAVFLTFGYWREVRKMEHDTDQQRRAVSSLEASVQEARNHKRVIENAGIFCAELASNAGARVRLLDCLVQNTQKSITLRSLSFTGDSFTIEGVAYEGIGAAASPVHSLLDALSANSSLWVISPESRPQRLTNPAFVIQGTFKN